MHILWLQWRHIRSDCAVVQNKDCFSKKWAEPLAIGKRVKLAVRALFREIANQSLYTSHNIADFIYLWFCEKLDKKLAVSSSLTFCENTNHLARTTNTRWEKWLVRWFTKCHLYTSHFSHFWTSSQKEPINSQVQEQGKNPKRNQQHIF